MWDFDSFFAVAEYLSVSDLLNLAETCSRFRDYVQYFLKLRFLKSEINISKTFLYDVIQLNGKNFKITTIKEILQFFRICGRQINHLRFIDLNETDPILLKLFEYIVYINKNVKSLSFQSCNLRKFPNEYVFDNLIEIKFINCVMNNTLKLNEIAPNLKHLYFFNIIYNKIPSSYIKFYKNLKTIGLYDSYDCNYDKIKEFLSINPHIECVDFALTDSNGVNTVISQLPNLNTIILRNYFGDFTWINGKKLIVSDRTFNNINFKDCTFEEVIIYKHRYNRLAFSIDLQQQRESKLNDVINVDMKKLSEVENITFI